MRIRKGEELKAGISAIIIALSFMLLFHFIYMTLTGNAVSLSRYVCVCAIDLAAMHVLSTTFCEQ